MAFERMAAVYNAGRTPTGITLRRWRNVLDPYLRSVPRSPVLDLGAGTGLWAEALATWFDVAVVAVEPSDAMRREGSAQRGSIAWWVGGSAGRLPLKADSCGAAWLSSVIHHFDDLGAAAAELRRVLLAGAPLLIRNGFPGPLRDRDPLYRFFPGARRFADAFPTIDRVVEAFGAARFALREHRVVDEVVALGLADYLGRVRTRADSTLVRLSDEEFAAGLAHLERASANDHGRDPVVDGWDFLAFA
jgi:SAM-dependent methyltransferase